MTSKQADYNYIISKIEQIYGSPISHHPLSVSNLHLSTNLSHLKGEAVLASHRSVINQSQLGKRFNKLTKKIEIYLQNCFGQFFDTVGDMTLVEKKIG